MVNAHYSRISALNGLPELIVRIAGQDALEHALEKQDLTTTILDTPDAIFPMRDLYALYRNAAEVTGLRSFGLDAVRDIDIKDYGVLGKYTAQAPDLRSAFVRLQKGQPHYSRGARLTLQESDDECIIGYENVYQNASGYRQMGGGVVRILEGVVRSFFGTNWTPCRILTPFFKGNWAQDYEDAYSAPVTFGNDKIAMVLGRDLVDQATNTAKVDRGALISFADVQRMGLEFPADFPSVVAHVVSLRLATGRFSLEDTAAALCLGPRTLQRRLYEHGLNYRDLALNCRMRRARELLAEPETIVDRVALEAGYASAPQFYRAFKVYVGTTPEGYRAALPQNGLLSYARP